MDFNELSEQQKMEMMIRNVGDSSMFKDENNEFMNVEEWGGVFYRNQTTIRVIIFSNQIIDFRGGKIDFTYTPSNLRELVIYGQSLKNEIDVSIFPRTLEIIDLNDNKIRGKICCSDLPPYLRMLRVSNNELSGVFDLKSVPLSMKYIYLHNNYFVGPMDLVILPPHLERLNFANNDICQDAVIVGSLPITLDNIDMTGNEIAHVIDLNGDEINDHRIKKH